MGRASGMSLATLAVAGVVFGAAQAQTPAAVGPTGKYGAVMEYDPSVTPYQTVYRPRDIGPADKFPIVAFGNGGCVSNGAAGARLVLMQLASEGYLVVAPGKPGADPSGQPGGPPPGARPPGPPPGAGAPAAGPPRPNPNNPPTGPAGSNTADVIAGIDWAVRENARPGGVLFHHINTGKVAVSGHSCGGLQGLEAAADPRVTTALLYNTGILPGVLRGTTMNKEKLALLHTPVFLIQGGKDDVAYEPALLTFATVKGIPFVMGEIQRGHGGTFRDPNGGEYSRVGKAWLDWQLKGDKKAGAMFTGASCGLCGDAQWKVSRKDMN